MEINPNSSKDAMLVWLQRNLDRRELIEFAKAINSHPLTTCEIPERGGTQDILLSLRMVSKAVLWSQLSELLEDEYEDEESEIDEDEQDDHDC